MVLLYGRAGRLTARNGGFRPGQFSRKFDDLPWTKVLLGSGDLSMFAVMARPELEQVCGARSPCSGGAQRVGHSGPSWSGCLVGCTTLLNGCCDCKVNFTELTQSSQVDPAV